MTLLRIGEFAAKLASLESALGSMASDARGVTFYVMRLNPAVSRNGGRNAAGRVLAPEGASKTELDMFTVL